MDIVGEYFQVFAAYLQVASGGESRTATESQEEVEEHSSLIVEENAATVSPKKQGPTLHNWSADWSFWVRLFFPLFESSF